MNAITAIHRSSQSKKWIFIPIAFITCMVLVWKSNMLNEKLGVPQAYLGKKKAGPSIVHLPMPSTKLQSGVETTPAIGQTVRVLIVAYFRSGSSLTGSIFNENNEAFYHFEPLFPLYRKTMMHHLPLKYINGSQRQCPKDNMEAFPVANHIIASVLDCRFRDLDISSIIFMLCSTTSNSALAFCHCIRGKEISQIVTECLPDYTKLCLQSKYRVIKTIRLDMESVRPLIKIYPDLKIIHLLRDPRGRVCSSLVANKCTVDETYVKELCDQGSKDIVKRLELEKKYPNSFKQVIYEEMAADPEGTAKAIYRFVGTELPVSVRNSLLTKNNPVGKDDGPYGLYRKNGLLTAYKWSKSIPWPVAELVNRHCQLLLRHAQFPNITSQKDLSNFNIPQRQCPNDNKEAFPVANHIIASVLDCRFRDLDISSIIFMLCSTTSNSALAFCHCIRGKEISQIVTECLPDYTKLCLQSKYRVIKTIRLDMESVRPLIKIYPDLKIIHLLRDPRGRVCSSLVANKCTVDETYVKELCDQGSKDIVKRLELEKKYPNSFKQVIYEEMAADPEGTAKAIYRFVGTELPVSVRNSLLAKNNPVGKDDGPYGLYRKNGLLTAYKWSKSIPWPVAELVNRHCQLLLRHAQFPNITSQKDLSNFKIPQRLKNASSG